MKLQRMVQINGRPQVGWHFSPHYRLLLIVQMVAPPNLVPLKTKLLPEMQVRWPFSRVWHVSD